ncbi:MAG: hypothetical protein ACLR2E_04310 [Lachnospiraceae bacterium]
MESSPPLKSWRRSALTPRSAGPDIILYDVAGRRGLVEAFAMPIRGGYARNVVYRDLRRDGCALYAASKHRQCG